MNIRAFLVMASNTVVHRISDIEDRAFIQVSYSTPSSARTRREALEEVLQHPEAFEVPALMKIETNGGRWDEVDTTNDDGIRLRQIRRNIRQTLAPLLLEALERMRGTVFALEDTEPFFQSIARFVLYDTRTVKTAESTIRNSAPDCAFDEAMGFPCSEKQRERAAKFASGTKKEFHY